MFDVHLSYSSKPTSKNTTSKNTKQPNTTIISGPQGTIEKNKITFEWTGSSDRTATKDLIFSYKLKGKDTYWSNWTEDNKVIYNYLKKGDYTFKVKARDPSGNVDPTPATRSFTSRALVPGTEKWSFRTKADYLWDIAVSKKEVIYMGGSNGKVYAINSDGTKKWSMDVGAEPANTTIGSTGTIYFTDNETGKLYAVESNGHKEAIFGLKEVNNFFSPALDEEGTLYLAENLHGIYALTSEGRKKWHFTSESGYINTAPVIGPKGDIYFGTGHGRFYAINSDGTKKWSRPNQLVYSSPAVDQSTVYFGRQTLNHNNFYAISLSNGKKKWSEKLNFYFKTPLVIGPEGFYVGSNYKLYALNSDGTIKWSFSPESYTPTSFQSPIVGSDGTVYTATTYHKLYALNSDGTIKWSFSPEESGIKAPVIGPSGTIYVTSKGVLYSLSGESKGLSDTPWPTFQNDSRRAGSAN